MDLSLLYITTALYILLSIYLGLKKGYDRQVLFYSVFCFGIAAWAMTNILFQRVDTLHQARLLALLAYSAASFMLWAMCLFSKYVIKDVKTVISDKYIHILLIISLLLPYLGNLIVIDVIDKESVRTIVTTKFVYLLFLSYITFIGLSFRFLIQKLATSKGINASQLKYVTISIGVAVLFGVLFNIVFPSLQNYSLVTFGPVFSLVPLGTVAYSIIRHRLFGINFIIGRTIYIIALAVLPFGMFHIVYFLQIKTLGTIYSTQAYFMGFVYSIIFNYLLFGANTKLNQWVNDNIIYSGYNPIKLRDELSKSFSSILSLNKLIENIFSTLDRSVKTKKAMIVLADLEKSEFILKRYHKFNKSELDMEKDLTGIIKYWKSKDHIDVVLKDEIDKNELEKLDHDELKNVNATLEFFTKNDLQGMILFSQKDGLDGALFIGMKDNETSYTVQDVDFLENITRDASVAIGRALLYNQVEDFAHNLEKKVEEATKELESKNKLLEKRAKALEEAAMRERDMMDIVGHELRTPATVVKSALGFMQMLSRMGKLTDEKVTTYVKRAADSIQREISLINTFLGAAKIEGDQMQFDPAPFSMQELIKNAVRDQSETAAAKGLKLLYKPQEGIPHQSGDPVRIREVLDNLISNAIKYSEKGTISVWCEVSKDKKNVITYVKDEGYGISPEDKKKLFRKFGRLKNYSSFKDRASRIVRPGGTGLGLYVTKGIINLHGGEIDVDSVVGKGSTFWFSLPIEMKISSNHLLNPVFRKDGSKNVFDRLKLTPNSTEPQDRGVIE